MVQAFKVLRFFLGIFGHEKAGLGTKGNERERKGTNGNIRARMGTNGYGLGNYLRGDYGGTMRGLGVIP